MSSQTCSLRSSHVRSSKVRKSSYAGPGLGLQCDTTSTALTASTTQACAFIQCIRHCCLAGHSVSSVRTDTLRVW